MAVLLETSGTYDEVEMRRCSRCCEAKPIDEFPIRNKTRGLRRVWCRYCCRAYGREHYRRNKPAYLAKAARRRKAEITSVRAMIRDYLAMHPCVDCGEADLLLLDFDHRDPTEKRGIISRLARSGSWPAVLREIEKCDVRCANCHRRRTAEQLNWRKDPHRGVLDRTTIDSLGPVLTRPSSSGQAVIEQLSLWTIGMTKRCSKCGLHKALHEFSLRDRMTGARQDFCRKCQAEYRRGHYARNRERYVSRAIAQMRKRKEDQTRLLHEYLAVHQCADCGETDIQVLEFDHVDPADKVMEVSHMVGRRSWVVILEEIGKCDVVCTNCHRRRTAERQGWIKRLGETDETYVRIDITAGVAQW